MTGKYFYVILGAILALIVSSLLRIGIWEFILTGVVVILLMVVFRGRGRSTGDR